MLKRKFARATRGTTMLSATFIGEVQQGRLHIGQPLAEFEGKRVLVTLIAPDTPLSLSEQASAPAPRVLASLEAELLEDTGRIRLPQREFATVQINLVDVGRLPMRVYSSDEED
jgi:hypothetical protein